MRLRVGAVLAAVLALAAGGCGGQTDPSWPWGSDESGAGSADADTDTDTDADTDSDADSDTDGEDIGDEPGEMPPPDVDVDVDVGGIVKQVSGNGSFLGHAPHHTCAVLEGGSVRCWGSGRYGELGYGNTESIGDDETPASAGDVPLW